MHEMVRHLVSPPTVCMAHSPVGPLPVRVGRRLLESLLGPGWRIWRESAPRWGLGEEGTIVPCRLLFEGVLVRFVFGRVGCLYGFMLAVEVVWVEGRNGVYREGLGGKVCAREWMVKWTVR